MSTTKKPLSGGTHHIPQTCGVDISSPVLMSRRRRVDVEALNLTL